MNKNGSAILIVLFMTTILSFITFDIWYKSSLVLDLVIAREKFYKNFYLTESFFEFGVNLVKDHFEAILLEEEWPIKYDLSFLLESINKSLSKTEPMYKNFYVDMILNKKKINSESVYIFVSLYNKDVNKVVCSICCKLKKEVVSVDDSKKTKKKNIFIIKNYTIGTIV